MITAKEVLVLVLALIILVFSNSFKNILEKDTSFTINSLFIFAIILIIYVAAKKLTAYYYEAEEETKIWNFQRYGLYERSYFKYPIPIGIILPFLLSIITFGSIPWFAVTESDVKPTEARAAKRHQIYSLIIAPIAYILNLQELAKASIYFACFNLLPLGKLDGSRVFFGSLILWVFLAAISLIALSYALLLV